MVTANETAEKDIKPKRGIYLMTDIYGNQRKTEIIPAEKSILIKLLEKAPKLHTNENYDTFLYKKGSCRLKFDAYNTIYCWDNISFKVYPENGLEPLYFEFEKKS